MKFNVGNLVKVIDQGYQYVHNAEWVEREAKEYSTMYQYGKEAPTGEVLRIVKRANTLLFSITLYLCSNGVNVFLFNDQGIELVQKGKVTRYCGNCEFEERKIDEVPCSTCIDLAIWEGKKENKMIKIYKTDDLIDLETDRLFTRESVENHDMFVMSINSGMGLVELSNLTTLKEKVEILNVLGFNLKYCEKIQLTEDDIIVLKYWQLSGLVTFAATKDKGIIAVSLNGELHSFANNLSFVNPFLVYTIADLLKEVEQ